MTLDRLTQITSSGISSTAPLTGINITGVITATSITATNYGSVNATTINASGVSTFQASSFWGDGDVAYFGTDNDLLIFHNSTDSIIRDTGTGDLYIEGGNVIRMTSPTGIETYANFNQDSSVELYYDGNKKFETTSGGAKVSGDLVVSGVSTTTVLNVGTGGTVITTSSSSLVGIGTTNPTQLLDVYNGNFSVYTPTSGQSIRIRTNNGTVGELAQISGDGTLRLYTNEATPILRTYVSSYGNTYFNPLGGNVAVGVTNPTSGRGTSGKILNVTGQGVNSVLSVQSVDGTNDRNAILELLSSGNGGSSAEIVFGDTDSTPGTNSPLIFSSYYSGSTVERLRIDSSGNIEARGGNSGFVAPSRRTISSVIRYGTGFSYRDPSDNIRPVIHVKVASLGGNGAANMGGGGVWVNGVNIGNTGRSWGLYVISGGGSNIGQLLVANTYDIYGNGALQTNMINDIATYFTNDNVIIINTQDEPETNAATLRTTLRDTYGAKLSNAAAYRYAYCYAFRYGFGALAEQNSGHFDGTTYSLNGNNSRATAGISFSVVL